MPTADRPYIHYRSLAEHLSRLPLDSHKRDVIAHLRTFDGAERLVPAIEALPDDTEPLVCFRAVGEALKAENPRFDVGMFWEWCCEYY